MPKQVMENRQLVFENAKSIRERINQGFRPLERMNNLLIAIKENGKKLNDNESFELWRSRKKKRNKIAKATSILFNM